MSPTAAGRWRSGQPSRAWRPGWACEAKAAEASAVRQGLTLEIERLKLEIALVRRQRFGPSAERSARAQQLELSLEYLEEAAAEADRSPSGSCRRDDRSGWVYPPKPAPASASRAPAAHGWLDPAPAACPGPWRACAQAGRGGDREPGAGAGGAGSWSSTCARRCPAARCEAITETPAPCPSPSHAGVRGRTSWLRRSSPSTGCTRPCIAKASALRARAFRSGVSTLAHRVGAGTRSTRD